MRSVLLGFLIASFPIFQLFGAPFFGLLSDRVGRKKVFLVTIGGGILGYFLSGIGVQFKSLFILWIGRIISGFFAGNLTLCLAAIVDISKIQSKRSKNIGIVGVIGGLGFVLGIFVGGSFSDSQFPLGSQTEIPFFIASGLSLLNFVLIFWFFREKSFTKPRDILFFIKIFRSIRSALRKAKVGMVYAVYFFFMIAWFTSLQFLSSYLYRFYKVRSETISLTFFLIAMVWSLTNFIINPLLIKFFQPKKIFFFGTLFVAVFLILILISQQPLSLFLFYFMIVTLFSALSWTNGLAFISACAGVGDQGVIFGINQSIVGIATVTGAIVGGFLTGIDIDKLYLFTGSCAFFGAILLLIRLCFFTKEAR